MITAMNYAAQAERALREYSKTLAGRDKLAHETSLLTAGSIKNAKHFAIPDGGIVFDDDFRGLDLQNIRLPFNEITIEWFAPRKLLSTGDYCPKRCLVASEIKGIGVIVCIGLYQTSKENLWHVNDFRTVLKMDNTQHSDALFDGKWIKFILPDGRLVEIAASPTSDKLKNAMSSGKLSSETLRDMIDNSCQEISGLFALLEALSCRNVIAEPREKVDQAKNARRIKDGKLPIYETKILTVDTSARHNEKLGMTVTDRASVRQHLRRGHIRRHPTAGNIWVQSCVVGYQGLGVIDKSYAVH